MSSYLFYLAETFYFLPLVFALLLTFPSFIPGLEKYITTRLELTEGIETLVGLSIVMFFVPFFISSLLGSRLCLNGLLFLNSLNSCFTNLFCKITQLKTSLFGLINNSITSFDLISSTLLGFIIALAILSVFSNSASSLLSLLTNIYSSVTTFTVSFLINGVLILGVLCAFLVLKCVIINIVYLLVLVDIIVVSLDGIFITNFRSVIDKYLDLYISLTISFILLKLLNSCIIPNLMSLETQLVQVFSSVSLIGVLLSTISGVIIYSFISLSLLFLIFVTIETIFSNFNITLSITGKLSRLLGR